MINQNFNKSADQRPPFTDLLEKYGRELYAYLVRMLGNQQDAEDCLQDTYLRALGAFERTWSESNYRAWLYKIATNVARTHLQKHQRDERAAMEGEHQIMPDPQEALVHKEQVHLVVAAMARLSFRQRSAILLRKYNELTYEEIGQALDCTPETARAHVYQGIKKLKEKLGDSISAKGKSHASR